ncbi:MAG TPA: peptide deformylase [Acidimicrobiales bacterium]|nr:peptide deformylase [Acidimicrobiales bacterium]
MSVLPIRLLGDPVLRQPCAPVTRFDDPLRRVLRDLADTCRVPGRAGVAAPQIGVELRAFAYNVEGVEGYVVNPLIVHLEGEIEDLEGCLSIPRLSFPTRRAERAVVRGVDRLGRVIEIEGSGQLARCLQHETDHLDGRLYIDRLDKDVRRRALRIIRDRQIGR